MIESTRLPALGGFALHPQLAGDTFALGRFPLSLVLLMNEARYPWFIFVPQRAGVVELHDLDERDQQQLMHESCAFAAYLKATFKGDKMNVAALGNVVPQLHVHHIVRFRGDPAWPAPVWGRLPAERYAPDALNRLRERVGDFGQIGIPFEPVENLVSSGRR